MRNRIRPFPRVTPLALPHFRLFVNAHSTLRLLAYMRQNRILVPLVGILALHFSHS